MDPGAPPETNEGAPAEKTTAPALPGSIGLNESGGAPRNQRGRPPQKKLGRPHFFPGRLKCFWAIAIGGDLEIQMVEWDRPRSKLRPGQPKTGQKSPKKRCAAVLASCPAARPVALRPGQSIMAISTSFVLGRFFLGAPSLYFGGALVLLWGRAPCGRP